jgi:hypothetical protein
MKELILDGDLLELKHNYPFRIGLISDFHVGAQQGVHPFGYKDRETGEGFGWGRLNDGQKTLWKYLTNFCAKMDENKVNTLGVLGDIIGGQNWIEKGAYMMYVDMGIQIRSCAKLISDICKMVPSIEKVILFKGTPYHGSKELSAEAQVVGELNAYYNIKAYYLGEYAFLTLRYGKNKKVIWLAHSATGATMYPETVLGRDIGQFLQAYATNKIPKVDMIIRAHRHEYMELHKSSIRYMILPCWQFYVPYDKAVQWYAKWQPDIGGAILLADEELRLRPWHFTYPNLVNPQRFLTLRHTSDDSLKLKSE